MKNLTNDLNRCISANVFQHLILEDCQKINKIAEYGNSELQILIIHYGKKKEHTFNGITNTQNPDINENKTCVEWQGFKHFMYLKHDAHCHKIEIEMQSYKEDEKEKKETLKTHTHTHTHKNGLHNLLKEMKIDGTLSSVYPNCYKAT